MIVGLWGVGADAARIDKIIYGVLASLVAVVLVQAGGYKLFEKVMSVCIAVMFVVVLVTAAALRPDVGEVGLPLHHGSRLTHGEYHILAIATP